MATSEILAPHEVAPGPVMGYLYSYRNIAGSLLALAGLVLFFLGIVGALWPVVVLGLYAVGFLIAPGNRNLDLVGGTFDAAGVRAALARQVEVSQKRLSPELAAKVSALSDTITGILPHYADFAAGSQDLFVVGQTATQYLPSALQAYINLPPTYAATVKLPNGKTAAENLSEQLDLLNTRLQQVAVAVSKKDSDALLANGRFLESKFGASPLGLPTTS